MNNNNINKRSIQELKARLLVMRNEIAESIRHIEKDTLNKSQRDASGDLSGYSFHMADMATDNFDREFNLDIGSKEQQLLNQIENALSMIEEGTYGKCEDCEQLISIERLRAVPFARLCIKCQEASEKREKEG
ncbi:MAG: TraR/DksA family transcriptional regulator [Candidatus Omnitrophica bacterium]|nr:TraR/DksA family transcriptional regulator [Candidatus Omnitrophota bacterium]